MADTRYSYEAQNAIRALISLDGAEDGSIIAPLNAWFNLESNEAPIEYHNWFMIGDEEMCLISAKDGFMTWANSEVADEIYMANAIRSERSEGTRMAISFGMGRGKTSEPVKEAWRASYRRTC
tara:strand:+ start:9721 stop:10089 length:369 start_codon:yes stop_codon:yes gene_type:complete